WAFNDEQLARTIVQSPVPVVCGVGHETDFTIADFCADLRAPTPTAAAELIAQPRAVWLGALDLVAERLQDGVQRQIDLRSQRLDHLALRLGRPSGVAAREQQRLSVLQGRMRHALLLKLQQLTQSQQALEAKFTQTLQQRLAAQGDRLDRCTLRLELLAPQRVLERGYAILHNAQGHALTSVQHIRQGEALQAQLADGRLEVQVQAVQSSV
ncbi:MAG: exodeoxyribonuclease VII large subunit, partial [Giesbergeria sp.]